MPKTRGKEFGAHVPRRMTGKPSNPVPTITTVDRVTDFREMVRNQPCCAPNSLECSGDVIAHHQPPTGRRGPADHRMVVALCVHHHRLWHDQARLAPWDNQQTKEMFKDIQLQQFGRWS